MRRLGIVAAILGTPVLVIAIGLVLLVARGGISARTPPSRGEAWVARKVRSWAIPSSASELRNPIPGGPRVLAAGRAHFADHCAVCHANDGSGDTPVGRNLYPRAPDMRKPETQSLTDGELYYIIENGVRLTGMPAWGGEGNAEGSWHLVHFIRHLSDLTDEEKAEMERLNPKSPDEWRALQEEVEFLEGKEPAPRQPEHGAHSH